MYREINNFSNQIKRYPCYIILKQSLCQFLCPLNLVKELLPCEITLFYHSHVLWMSWRSYGDATGPRAYSATSLSDSLYLCVTTKKKKEILNPAASTLATGSSAWETKPRSLCTEHNKRIGLWDKYSVRMDGKINGVGVCVCVCPRWAVRLGELCVGSSPGRARSNWWCDPAAWEAGHRTTYPPCNWAHSYWQGGATVFSYRDTDTRTESSEVKKQNKHRTNGHKQCDGDE